MLRAQLRSRDDPWVRAKARGRGVLAPLRVSTSVRTRRPREGIPNHFTAAHQFAEVNRNKQGGAVG